MSVLEVPLKQGLLASMTENRLLLELSDAPEGLSRSEIAQRTGISKPAISDAARRLEESGVIVSTGTRGGKRGGVATVYAINGDRGHSIAIALDSMSVSARVTTLDGTVVDELSERLPRGAGRGRVITTANTMLASIKSGVGSPLLATAVSMADPVDRNTGEIIVLADAVFPGGHINPLEDLHLDPANSSVDNDVNWATLAEHHDGDQRVVEPPHLPVRMQTLEVLAVAIEQRTDSAELDAVSRPEVHRRLPQQRRPVGGQPGAEPLLRHVLVVAEDLVLLPPRTAVHRGELAGGIEHERVDDVDPRRVVEVTS